MRRICFGFCLSVAREAQAKRVSARALFLRRTCGRLSDFIFFHPEIRDKVLGQFLEGFDMRMQPWSCAVLNVLHGSIERLP